MTGQRLCWSVHNNVINLRENLGAQLIPQCGNPLHLRIHLVDCFFQSRSSTHCPRHIGGAWANAAFLPASEKHSCWGWGPRRKQQSCPPGATEFVGTGGQGCSARLREGDRDVAYGLHGVDMHGGSLPGGGRHNVTDGLDGASFVVGPHAADQRSRGIQRAPDANHP